MRNKHFFGMIACITLAIGLVLTGCDLSTGGDDTGGDGTGGSQKTLVIQGIPAAVYAYGSAGGGIGIFPVNTTDQQAYTQQGVVAGADLTDAETTGSGPYTLTIPLYNTNDNKRWTGQGTYNIYVVLNGGGGHYYKASNVTISSETTTIPFSSAVAITFDGGGDGEGDETNAQKTLVIQDIPAAVYAYGSGGGGIGIFPTTTTDQQAYTQEGVVAGADLTDAETTGSGPYTLTIPLYNTDDNKRWTGQGTYNIYVALNGGGGHYYKASNVTISSGTTTIPFSSAVEITFDGGE
jgi:hypothetical protein